MNKKIFFFKLINPLLIISSFLIFIFLNNIKIIYSMEVEKIELDKLSTEQRNPETMNLDEMSSLEIVTAMNNEDQKVPLAIKKILPNIAKAVDWVSDSIEIGGRVFYLGAGTSGRLSVCDAAECPPTFSADPNTFIALMAGGSSAFIKAVEGAEDSLDLAKKDLKEHFLCKKDIVIGVAASGRTPYVIGGLQYAKELGCKTISISCSQNSKISQIVDLSLEVLVGPEILTGSTRLKAGTAQKLILNMISTGAMIKNGKVYQNLMVDLMQSNKKLHVRAENIVMEATGISREESREYINKAKGSVKVAIFMILSGSTYEESLNTLSKAKGHVKKALSLDL